MNKLVLLFVISLFAVACGGKFGDNEFLVKGEIKNSAGKTIFLSKYTEAGPLTIDSVQIDESGEFKLTGRTSFPQFYMLRISPNEFVTLLIDSANVLTVNADAEDFVKSHEVEGSEDMVLMKKLNDRLYLSIQSIDSLGQIYQSYEGTEILDSVKGEIDVVFNGILESQREFSKKFIDENIGSMTMILALSQQVAQRVPVFSIANDITYFEKVDSALFKKYPQSEDVMRLHTFLGQRKEPQNTPVQGGGLFKIGDEVPNISLNNPDGKELSLYSLRGKYVLLDFWAGWCRPCRLESHNLVKNYKKFNAKGFEIFQVSLDKEKQQWVDAIEKDQLGAWSHVSDLQYWQSAPAKKYQISSIPASFLLDPKGKVIAVNLRGEQLGAILAEVFQ